MRALLTYLAILFCRCCCCCYRRCCCCSLLRRHSERSEEPPHFRGERSDPNALLFHHKHFDRSGSQPHREPRSGETRFSTRTATSPPGAVALVCSPPTHLKPAPSRRQK